MKIAGNDRIALSTNTM